MLMQQKFTSLEFYCFILLLLFYCFWSFVFFCVIDIVKNVLKDKPKWFGKVFQEASLTINQVKKMQIIYKYLNAHLGMRKINFYFQNFPISTAHFLEHF